MRAAAQHRRAVLVRPVQSAIHALLAVGAHLAGCRHGFPDVDRQLITEHGIGNGVSIIIFGGIVSRLPGLVGQLAFSQGGTGDLNVLGLLLFVCLAWPPWSASCWCRKDSAAFLCTTHECLPRQPGHAAERQQLHPLTGE